MTVRGPEQSGRRQVTAVASRRPWSRAGDADTNMVPSGEMSKAQPGTNSRTMWDAVPASRLEATTTEGRHETT